MAENLIVDLAHEEQQTDEKKADQIMEQIEAYAGALVGLLLGKEFSESAKFVLRRFGHHVLCFLRNVVTDFVAEK